MDVSKPFVMTGRNKTPAPQAPLRLASRKLCLNGKVYFYT